MVGSLVTSQSSLTGRPRGSFSHEKPCEFIPGSQSSLSERPRGRQILSVLRKLATASQSSLTERPCGRKISPIAKPRMTRVSILSNREALWKHRRKDLSSRRSVSQSSPQERPRGSMLQLVATVKSGSTVPFSVEILCICLVVLQLVAAPYRLSFRMSSNTKRLWNSEYELKLYSHLPCLSRFPPRQTEVML